MLLNNFRSLKFFPRSLLVCSRIFSCLLWISSLKPSLTFTSNFLWSLRRCYLEGLDTWNLKFDNHQWYNLWRRHLQHTITITWQTFQIQYFAKDDTRVNCCEVFLILWNEMKFMKTTFTPHYNNDLAINNLTQYLLVSYIINIFRSTCQHAKHVQAGYYWNLRLFPTVSFSYSIAIFNLRFSLQMLDADCLGKIKIICGIILNFSPLISKYLF